MEERGALDLSPIVAKLNSARAVFLRAADGISSEQRSAKPTTEGWSAAELVAHLVLVEQGIVATAARVIEKSPKAFAPWQRVHLLLWLAEVRILRLKSPVAKVPTSAALAAKESMLKEGIAACTRSIAPFSQTRRLLLETSVSGAPEFLRMV